MNIEYNLPENWKLKSLSTCVIKLESGNRPKGGVNNILDGIPSISGEHFNYDGSFKFQNLKYIPKEFFDKLNKGLIEANVTLIVKDGATTGKTAFINESFPYLTSAINEHVFLVKTDENKLINKCFYYFTNTLDYLKFIQTEKKGTTIGGITRNFMNRLVLPIPPIDIQKQIVDKLDALFQRINQVIQLHEENIKYLKDFLESSREQIFEHIFMDSNNPQLKILELVIKTTNVNPTKNNDKSKFIYIDISSIDNNICKIMDLKKIDSLNAPSRARQLVIQNDILFATTRPNLKNIAIVHTNEEDIFIASTGFCVLRCYPNKINYKFLYYYLQTNHCQKQIQPKIRGSQYPAISNLDLLNTIIALPSLSTQNRVVETLNKITENVHRIKILQQEKLQDLKELKASLLDKAFKGKLII